MYAGTAEERRGTSMVGDGRDRVLIQLYAPAPGPPLVSGRRRV